MRVEFKYWSISEFQRLDGTISLLDISSNLITHTHTHTHTQSSPQKTDTF